MVEVLKELNKLENELFVLKRKVYNQMPEKKIKYYFRDDKKDIAKIVKICEQTRKEMWKKEYEGKI